MKLKLTQLMLLTTLALPSTALTQPSDRAPGPDGDRPAAPQRPERDGDRERDRNRDRDRDRADNGRERGRDGDRRGQREPIPVELVDDAIATIREMHPDTPWLKRVSALADKDREKAALELGRFPRILSLIDSRKNRPEEFAAHIQQGKLMRAVFPLIGKYREANRNDDQAKMDELRPQIREHVKQVFEIRLEMKRLAIKKNEQELEQARKELNDLEAAKEALIDEKLMEMLNRSNRGPRGGDNDDRRRERDADRRGGDRPESE